MYLRMFSDEEKKPTEISKPWIDKLFIGSGRIRIQLDPPINDITAYFENQVSSVLLVQYRFRKDD